MVSSFRRRGFTLIEVLVASAVAGVAITAAFSFATFQIKAYSKQQDVTQLSSSSRIIEDALAEDIRSAGYGTSFWAGTGQLAAFAGRAVSTDAGGAPLGVPAIHVIDNVATPVGAPGLGVQPGSDAISILRVEGASTNIPSSGPGATGMTTVPGAGVPYVVNDLSALAPCGSGNGSRLVLISDMVRSSQPASMLLQIANIPANAPIGQGNISFVNGAYGLNPGNAGAAGGVMPAPRQFGPGALVTCVRLVTYWVDNIGRLRMFQSTPGNPAGAVPPLQGAVALGNPIPIDPVNDRVLADGVMDMQLALYMSRVSPIAPEGWVYDAVGLALANVRQHVEVRAVRISATISTPRPTDAPGARAPTNVENRALNAAIFTSNYTYRTYVVTADLKNMRIFDLMSSVNQQWNTIRSYPE